MLCAAVRTLRGGCARVLGERRAACVVLVRKQKPTRITFAACVHGKDSVFKSLLALSSQHAVEESLASQTPAVSFNKADQDSLLQNVPNQPENPKILKVAIIGAPNAGKSTLSNQLLGRKLFPVSSKVHTTRTQAQGVITEGDTQIILLDTPGMVNAIKVKRHNLEKSLQQDPWEAVKLADVVLVLVDVTVRWMKSSLHLEVLKCLSKYPDVPSILVLNKVDLLKDKSSLLEITNKLTKGVVKGKKAKIREMKCSPKRKEPTVVKLEELEDFTEESDESQTPDPSSDVPEDHLTNRISKGKSPPETGWSHFHDVFMLSAIQKDDTDTLKTYLMNLAKPGEWEFHSDVATTQSPEEICDNIIREKLLEYLPQEIPYNVTQITNLWEEGSSGELVIVKTLLVGRENHVKLLIGAGGQNITRISNEAARDLMNVFLCDVRLRMTVKFKN